jgi:hypothetical protein
VGGSWAGARAVALRSVSYGFTSGSQTPPYHIETERITQGCKLALRLGWRPIGIHKQFQFPVRHLNLLPAGSTNEAGTGRRTMQTKRYWLDYDPVALAVLVIGIGAIELLALSI